MTQADFTMGGPTLGSGSNLRLPVVLCLDTSGSMNEATNDGTRIDQLNRALMTWRTELTENPLLRRQADICVLTFADKVSAPSVGPAGAGGFVAVQEFEPSTLTAGGTTRLDLVLGEAVARLDTYTADTSVEKYRGKIWILSDGLPSDADGNASDRLWRPLLPMLKSGEANGRFAVFAAGVHGANMHVLREIAGRGAFDLSGLPFSRILRVVSDSVGRSKTRVSVDEEKDEISDTVDKLNKIFGKLGRRP